MKTYDEDEQDNTPTPPPAPCPNVDDCGNLSEEGTTVIIVDIPGPMPQ